MRWSITSLLRRGLSLAVGIAALVTAPQHADAQCTATISQAFPTPSLAFGSPGIMNTNINWDPDGAGPQAPLYVVGGFFTAVDERPASNIAAFNRETNTWLSLGTGTNAIGGDRSRVEVQALVVTASNELIAAYRYDSPTGTSFLFNIRLSKWNGTTWTDISPDLIAGCPCGGLTECTCGITTLFALPSGDIVAGGQFSIPTAPSSPNIARLSGSTWLPYGSGIGGNVHDIELFGGATLVAAGMSSSTFNGISRWNGTTWVDMNPGGATRGDSVRSLNLLSDGSLAVGGIFSQIAGVNAQNIARWTGTLWSPLGTGVPVVPPSESFSEYSGLWRSTILSDGRLVVSELGRLHAWNGSSWQELSQFPDGRPVELLPTGTGGLLTRRFQLEGSIWSKVSMGFDGPPTRFLPLNGGTELLATGRFTSVNGRLSPGIARRDAQGVWRGLGSGLNSPFTGTFPFAGRIDRAVQMPNGDLFVAGQFQLPGAPGVPVALARWDGTTWFPVAIPPQNSGAENVQTLVVSPSGELFFGFRNLHRWNGSQWIEVPGLVSSLSTIQSMAFKPNGELIVTGSINVGGNNWRIASWNGSTWSQIDAPASLPLFDTVKEILVVSNDLFYVISGGGFFRWTPSSGVTAILPALFTSSSCQLTLMPDNRILVTGEGLIGGPGTPGFPTSSAIWDGTAWSSLLDPNGQPVVSSFAAARLAGNTISVAVKLSSPFNNFTSLTYDSTVPVFSSPVITSQTTSAAACGTSGAPVGVTLQGSPIDATVSWQVEQTPDMWVNITTSPLNLTSGGTISRAAGSTPSTQIFLANRAFPVKVRAIAQTTCSSAVTSQPMQIFLNVADMGEQGGFNGSDGVYDNNDFIVFIDRFFAQQSTADIGSQGAVLGSDGTFDNNDFIVFINQFFAGC